MKSAGGGRGRKFLEKNAGEITDWMSERIPSSSIIACAAIIHLVFVCILSLPPTPSQNQPTDQLIKP